MRVALPAVLVTAVLLGLAAAGPARAAELNRPPAGFKALFNGKDLTNWQGLVELPQRAKLSPQELKEAQARADELMRAHWSVKDGILVFDGKGQSLQTARDYGNFELYVDWRIQKDGDSGIYLRGNPQVQIWDNPIGSGGLFNNQQHPSKPLVAADRPVCEWNTFFIRMVGDRVTVKLNGVTVVDDTPLENYWERGKPLPATGPIELQNHGNVLEFRNIFIRELADVSRATPAPLPEGGLVTLEVKNAPLAQVVQILAGSGGVEMILTDPTGMLAERQVSFISIKEKPFERALELLCRSAGLSWTRDESGVYFVALRR
jgi:hypothetical protein